MSIPDIVKGEPWTVTLTGEAGDPGYGDGNHRLIVDNAVFMLPLEHPDVTWHPGLTPAPTAAAPPGDGSRPGTRGPRPDGMR